MVVRNEPTLFEVAVQTENEGRYVVRVPVGSYKVTVSANSFGSYVVSARYLDVGRPRVTNFQFAVGDRTGVSVDGQTPLIDGGTATVGDAVTAQAVQQIMRTRLPAGEAESSGQIHLDARLTF